MAGLEMYHYGARFYSPKLGRFLSPDTIIQSYVNPQTLNRMSYVNNNPLRYIDPSGHYRVEDQGSKRGCSDKGYCIDLEMNIKIGREYSKDEAHILRDMLRRGKEVAHHAVDYIVNHDVHIYLDDDMYSGIGAQWRDDNLYVNSLQDGSNFDSLGDLISSNSYAHVVGLVAHEAKHLEQGGMTANSVYGEFEGWKTELEVRREMFQQVPKYGTPRDIILRTPLSHDPDVLGMVWRGMVVEQGFDYLVWLAPLDSDSMLPAILALH